MIDQRLNKEDIMIFITNSFTNTHTHTHTHIDRCNYTIKLSIIRTQSYITSIIIMNLSIDKLVLLNEICLSFFSYHLSALSLLQEEGQKWKVISNKRKDLKSKGRHVLYRYKKIKCEWENKYFDLFRLNSALAPKYSTCRILLV